MIDHIIGHFVNSGGPVINFSKEVSLQRCENKGGPNSSDLNEIEPCWNCLKDSMAQYNFIGSGEETKQHVQETLYTEWERMPQELIDRFSMNSHVNLLQARACGGDNWFNG